MNAGLWIRIQLGKMDLDRYGGDPGIHIWPKISYRISYVLCLMPTEKTPDIREGIIIMLKSPILQFLAVHT
jgi:hypothetical protein